MQEIVERAPRYMDFGPPANKVFKTWPNDCLSATGFLDCNCILILIISIGDVTITCTNPAKAPAIASFLNDIFPSIFLN